jgi:2-methylcitrate dehydratase PrpD
MENATGTLAQYIVGTQFRDFPGTTVQTAKYAILDNIGAAVAACRTDVGKCFLCCVSGEDSGPCTVVGVDGKKPIMEACFINSSLAQVLDFDDTYEIRSLGVSHPGPAVVWAALSAGEKQRCSGKELIRAVILGYESSIRVAEAIEPRQDEFWGFGNTQVIGAVTAASMLLGLNVEQTVNALGLAAATSPVPNTNMMWSLENRPMSWIKDGVGFASSTGVMCAMLAKNGFTGSQKGLDREDGYYLLCGSRDYKEERLVEEFGKPYKLDLLSFKPYPTCRFMQSTLDSVALIIEENKLHDEQIKTVEVYVTPYLARVFSVYRPASMIDAQFSLPYAVAMLLKRKTPSASWFAPDMIKNDEVVHSARKVKLIPDREVEKKRVGESILSPKVRITTQQGKIYKKQEYCAKGHPEKPFTRDDFLNKFRQNAGVLLDSDRITHLIEVIENLEGCGAIEDILRLLLLHGGGKK